MIKLSDKFDIRYSPDGHTYFHNGKELHHLGNRDEFDLAKKVLHYDPRKTNDPNFPPRGKTARSSNFFIHGDSLWHTGRVHSRRSTAKIDGLNRWFLRTSAIANPVMKVRTIKNIAAATAGTGVLAALGFAFSKINQDKKKKDNV